MLKVLQFLRALYCGKPQQAFPAERHLALGPAGVGPPNFKALSHPAATAQVAALRSSMRPDCSRHALEPDEEGDGELCRRSQPSVWVQMDWLEAISWHLCKLSQKLYHCEKHDLAAFDDLFHINVVQ